LRPPNEVDDGVEIVERDLETFEDVGPLFGFAKFIDRSTDDHFAPMLNEMVQDLLEVEDLRAVIDKREHNDAERRFELCVPVKIVQDDERNLVALELDDDPDTFAV
jgi:hypothetical protein